MLQAWLFWPLIFHPLAEEFELARLLAKVGKAMRGVGHESENVDAHLDVSPVFYHRDTCRHDDGPCPCPCPCPYFCPCPFRPHIVT